MYNIHDGLKQNRTEQKQKKMNLMLYAFGAEKKKKKIRVSVSLFVGVNVLGPIRRSFIYLPYVHDVHIFV